MFSKQPSQGTMVPPQAGLAGQMIQFALKILMVRIRLLPTVIFFSVMLIGVKVHHVSHKIKSGYDISMESVRAADTPAPTPATGGDAGTPAAAPIDPKGMSADEYTLLQEMEMKKAQGASANTAAASPAAAPAQTPSPAGAPANAGTAQVTPEAATDTRKQPQILKALEKRMDETVKQLDTSKEELNKLVKSIDQEENANTKRLVKMVEGMKPEQASKVLEGIEFKILLEIMETMSEKKASPILASMAPEKASYLMTALAKRKKIIKKDSPEKGVMTN